MTYTSALFLVAFIPLVMLLYQIFPKKVRPIILLIASFFFFYTISGKLVIFLILSIISIHYIGIWLDSTKKELTEKQKNSEDKRALKAAYRKKLRLILLIGLLANIGTLIVLKYSCFFAGNINTLLKLLSVPFAIPIHKFAVPIGISFYSLQAVSYIVDVYYGKIQADKNIGRLALYLSFFPTIMEGPICRYSETAGVLYEGNALRYRNITFGMQRMLWGLGKTLIIAQRLNIFVEKIFKSPDKFSGAIIFVGACAYTIQLYADFSGFIDITIGIGEIFGITLPENFRNPFFSRTASEFWRRWHITLGTWFKDYVFYPLSLTKFVKSVGKKTKKKFGKHVGQLIPSSIALFVVWICNGLWHGTGWNYLFFGIYYFVIIVLGNAFEPLVEKVTLKLKINRESVLYRIFQTAKMIIIIVFGELFFRAEGLAKGFSMVKSIFVDTRIHTLFDGSIFKIGLSILDFGILFLFLIVLLIVGIWHEKGIKIREKIATFVLPVRWLIYYSAILIIIIFGAYGGGYLPASMIYADF